MGNFLYNSVKKTGSDKFVTKAQNLWALEAIDIDGKQRHLSEFSNNKATIVVNVACK